MTVEIIGARLQRCTEPGSMGVVTNTIYRRCYWPHLDQPTALFAEGSCGIQVQGPPTPRNVVFPPDTVFLDQDVSDGGALIATTPRYFVTEQKVEQVQVTRTVTREVEIDDQTVTATFDETAIEQQTVEVVTELTEAQARDLAAGKTTREKLLTQAKAVG